jgi:hypothetical protein
MLAVALIALGFAPVGEGVRLASRMIACGALIASCVLAAPRPPRRHD